jgi:hypothetical protein
MRTLAAGSFREFSGVVLAVEYPLRDLNPWKARVGIEQIYRENDLKMPDLDGCSSLFGQRSPMLFQR